MVTEMDWFGPVVFEAGIGVVTLLLLLGLWWWLRK
jgi:hypothetical protein